MSKLKVDFDVFEQAINTYNTEVEGFRAARDGVQQALDDLKSSGWVSNAGTAWFDAADMDWVGVINYHIRVINELIKELKIASKEYHEVYEKQRSLVKHLN